MDAVQDGLSAPPGDPDNSHGCLRCRLIGWPRLPARWSPAPRAGKRHRRRRRPVRLDPVGAAFTRAAASHRHIV